MRILIVEDDVKISFFLKKGFQEVGGAADVADNGKDGLLLARQQIYDAVVADLMLPQLDGISMIERLRAEGVQVPVIILSARGSVDDRIRGLQAGGDDYMVKPFSFSELLVRIQTLLRRVSQGSEPSVLRLAGLTLDLSRRAVERDGQRIDLKPREYALLEYLLRNSGYVVTKTSILEQVYDYSFDPQTNVVDVLVCRLRNKVDKSFEKKLIHTVRGVGYVLREE